MRIKIKAERKIISEEYYDVPDNTNLDEIIAFGLPTDAIFIDSDEIDCLNGEILEVEEADRL